MSQLPHNILLIGLPSTGKTSFLAALWYAVQQTQINTALILKHVRGNVKYLNSIRDSWLAFKTVPRNTSDSENLVSMILKNRGSDDEINVTFPDISGESFRLQWTGRQLTTSYDNCLKSATGGIMFIHAESVIKPHRIDQVIDLAATTGQNAAPANSAQSTVIPWNADNSPTQVQLVELLQIMMGREHFRPPFRLAITVSAWDLLLPTTKTPEDWVAEQLPMLRQFLVSNPDQFHVGYYGVSAQGGDYLGDGVAELQKKAPARRIEIVGANVENSHDITEPLRRLM